MLYLQHGGGEDETGWGSHGNAGLIMDNLIAEGKTRPFIIVMANSYVPGAFGPGRGSASTNAAPAGGPGGAPGRRMFDFSTFTRVLIDDLISFIDTNSIEEPRKIVPRTERASGLSANFEREFPAHSVTVLKLKTK